MMHPVGPYAARTYWVRRALVAVVAVALVAGVVWWVLGRGSGPGPEPLGATTGETTTPHLTGVLATDPVTDSTTESDVPFTDSTAIGTGDSGAGSPDAQASDTTGTTVGDASSDTTGTAAVKTAATGTTTAAQTPAAAETSSTPPAAVTSPSGPTVVQTTAPVQVTVTVTKLAPATGTAAKTTAPKTTAPPKPSYDSAGRLICPAASISLTGVVWGTVSGQQPRLGMNVTNVSKQTCRQDVSGAAQVYTVYTAAGDRVWSTADCFPGEGHEVVSLGAGQKASYVIVWSGTTSEPGCKAPRVKVKAGNYKLVVQLGDLKSKPLPFTMG